MSARAPCPDVTTTPTPSAGHDPAGQHQQRLLAGYLAWATGTAALAPTTVAAYTSHIAGYLDWLDQHHPHLTLADTEPAHVEGYLAALAGRGCSAGTRRVALHGLRSFYAWALHRPDTPAAAVRRPRVRPPVTTPYTEAQADAILAAATGPTDAAATPRDRLAVAVLATLRWTGLRSHELCTLPRGQPGPARRAGHRHRQGPQAARGPAARPADAAPARLPVRHTACGLRPGCSPTPPGSDPTPR